MGRFSHIAELLVVRKADPPTERRLVYGIVLAPETVDSQGDIYSADAIELACHRFMASYQNVGEMHKALVNDGAEIVECYIAPVDMTIEGRAIKKGTWLIAVHLTSDRLWQGVKDGSFTGFSIGGFAERTPLT